MRKPTLLLSVVALFATVLGCHQGDEPVTKGGVNLMRPDWGVVLPIQEQVKLPEYCPPHSPAGLAGQWTPGRVEIDRLERRLSIALGKVLARVILENGETLPRPPEYYRQYGGFYRNSARVIYVCGLHRGLVEWMELTEKAYWTRKAMGADDGGLWVFGVVYDVEADKFGPVQFEGRFSGSVRLRWF